jgi:hypothetical protein
MAAIITEKFRQHNAEQFFESFSEASASTYYLFIGKSSPYTSGTTGGSDTSPPSPTDTVTVENYKWDAMLAAKQISSSDVAYVVPRRDWANGTTYDMYEHDVSATNTSTSGATNLYDSTFYFMTSEYRVYKVLDNNGGVAYSSASEPSSVTSTPFFAGGYYLQYMYTLSTSQIQKFLTSDFIPVTTDSTVSADAVTSHGGTAPFNGSPIKVVRVTAGSGYSDTNGDDGAGGGAGTGGVYYTPIRGDGTGGIVKIFVSGGAIAAFGSGGTATEVFDDGTGYTFGTIDLSDVYSDSALSNAVSIGSGIGGAITPVISPTVGHGYDAISELGGHYVMMNAKLEQAEGDDITVANDFREVGVVVDPYNFGTTTISSATTLRQTYAVKMSSSTGTFEPDEKITQATTGAVGRVVEWDSSNSILYYLQEGYEEYGLDSNGDYVAFSGTNTISGSTSAATGSPQSTASQTVTLTGGNTIVFTSGYANPEMEPDSGKVIYVENRRPISRASDQTEDIKIVVEF